MGRIFFYLLPAICFISSMIYRDPLILLLIWMFIGPLFIAFLILVVNKLKERKVMNTGEKRIYSYGKCDAIIGGRICRGDLVFSEAFIKHMEGYEEFTCERCGKTKTVSEHLYLGCTSSDISWGFGLLFGLAAIGGFLTGDYAPAFVTLLISIIILPPFIKLFKEKFDFELSRGLKIAVILILFLIWGSVVPDTTGQTTIKPSDDSQQTLIMALYVLLITLITTAITLIAKAIFIFLFILAIFFSIINIISYLFSCHHVWVEDDDGNHVCTKCGKVHRMTWNEYRYG